MFLVVDSENAVIAKPIQFFEDALRVSREKGGPGCRVLRKSDDELLATVEAWKPSHELRRR